MTVVDSLLYTVESEECVGSASADLVVPDPPGGIAPILVAFRGEGTVEPPPCPQT